MVLHLNLPGEGVLARTAEGDHVVPVALIHDCSTGAGCC
jgi:hypothetical protein